MVKKTKNIILTGVTLMSSITLFGSHPISVYAEEMNMTANHVSQYKNEKIKVKDSLSELKGTLKETEKEVLKRDGDEIKKKKKIKQRKDEIKNASEAEYKITKDGKEGKQFQDILKSIVQVIEIKDKMDVKTEGNEQVGIMTMPQDNLSRTVRMPESQTSTNIKNVEEKTKKVENKSNDETTSILKQIPLSKTEETEKEELFVYNNYLVETKGFNESQNGLQNVEVNIRTLSAVEKQLLELTDSPELFESVKNNILTQTDSTQKYNKTITVGLIDKTGPEIELSQESNELIVGDEFDLNKYIKSVTDKEDGELEYTTEGTVDVNKKGTYNLTISAKDYSGNVTEMPLSIVVKNDLQKTFYNKIAEAAKAQIGRTQDCTMLVTNSLAAVGIHFHGWPIEYAQLGEWTNNPVPGDIIIYQGHVALYIGNGRAIHGGFRGNQTVEWGVECSNGFIGYIHVTPPAQYR